MNCDINILKNSNDNNKLTVFVGAGVSKSSNLPDWSELISNIKKELGINKEESDYLKIAQLFYLSCGEAVYYQRLKDYFPENIEPTIIQKLIFDLKPANIITTNWDNLLEKTAQANGFIYDVVSRDEHLVQSKLQNHIIKMHGDFRDNNIVFKEDDYINYKNNFPLIENYVKSILSTNAILFLGYSYSDINLKQITKWIQNNSTVIPPMFLVVFKEDKNQSKYLENFGIKTIVIKNEDISFGLDSYSNKLATFLRDLIAPQEEHIDLQKMSDLDIVNFVNERLKPLDKLNAILLTQIQTTLTNCRFIYSPTKKGNVVLLQFHNYMSYDINKKVRDIYKRFKEVLKKKKFSESEEYIILEICSILYKANIDGIVLSEENAHTIESFEFPKIITSKINYNEKLLCIFKFDDFEANENNIKQLMKKAFIYYQKYDFFKAYNLNEKIIKLCLKQQNYIVLFLAMFNQNILLRKIQDPWYLQDTDEKDKYQIAQDNMRLRPYNLDEKFYELPKPIQQILQDIKPFVSFDYLYKFTSEIDDELGEKILQKKAMERNDGVTWDTNVTRNYSKQKNLIHFVLSNFIMMERSYQFITINKKLIKISLIRQMQKQFFIFDKMELFAIVKYITHKDLMELLKEFDDINFNFSTKTINWLIIKVFSNIVKLFNGDNSLYSHFADELKNILYLCTLQKLTKKQTQIVLEQTRTLISNSKINLDIYELINRLIDEQDNININDLLDILEMMINKVICNKGNIWDYEAIGNNYFWSPFKHLHEQKIVYENFSLIEKLLKELENYPDEQKIQLSKGFLINIYNISNDNIKQLIKDFMLSIELGELSKLKLDDLTAYDEYSLKISFKLFLAIKEFIEIDNDFINDIKLYALRKISNYVGEITNQVNYLVEKRDIKDLEEPLNHLREFINKISQERKYRSHSMII